MFICNFFIVVCICWLFYDLRFYLCFYIVEGDLEGKLFSLDVCNLVYVWVQGKCDMYFFGIEWDMDFGEYEWMSYFIVFVVYFEEDLWIMVGGEQCSQLYNVFVFNIFVMSFGVLLVNVIVALNKGVQLGNFYYDIGEGGISFYYLEYGGDLVWEIGFGYFGC